MADSAGNGSNQSSDGGDSGNSITKIAIPVAVVGGVLIIIIIVIIIILCRKKQSKKKKQQYAVNNSKLWITKDEESTIQDISGPIPTTLTPNSEYHQANYQYTAADDNQLNLTQGQVVKVTEKRKDGWWKGMIGEKEGIFPGNYVIPLTLGLANLGYDEDDAPNKANGKKENHEIEKVTEEPLQSIKEETVKNGRSAFGRAVSVQIPDTTSRPAYNRSKSMGPVQATVHQSQKPKKTYIVQLPYSPTGPGELELKVNEILIHKNEDPKGWLLARKQSTGQEGWFPRACVIAHDVTHEDLKQSDSNDSTGKESMPSKGEEAMTGIEYKALYDYRARRDADLSFTADSIIVVFEMLDSGWWRGCYGDAEGWFPGSYVQILEPSVVPVENVTSKMTSQGQTRTNKAMSVVEIDIDSPPSGTSSPQPKPEVPLRFVTPKLVKIPLQSLRTRSIRRPNRPPPPAPIHREINIDAAVTLARSHPTPQSSPRSVESDNLSLPLAQNTQENQAPQSKKKKEKRKSHKENVVLASTEEKTETSSPNDKQEQNQETEKTNIWRNKRAEEHKKRSNVDTTEQRKTKAKLLQRPSVPPPAPPGGSISRQSSTSVQENETESNSTVEVVNRNSQSIVKSASVLLEKEDQQETIKKALDEPEISNNAQDNGTDDRYENIQEVRSSIARNVMLGNVMKDSQVMDSPCVKEEQQQSVRDLRAIYSPLMKNLSDDKYREPSRIEQGNENNQEDENNELSNSQEDDDKSSKRYHQEDVSPYANLTKRGGVNLLESPISSSRESLSSIGDDSLISPLMRDGIQRLSKPPRKSLSKYPDAENFSGSEKCSDSDSQNSSPQHKGSLENSPSREGRISEDEIIMRVKRKKPSPAKPPRKSQLSNASLTSSTDSLGDSSYFQEELSKKDDTPTTEDSDTQDVSREVIDIASTSDMEKEAEKLNTEHDDIQKDGLSKDSEVVIKREIEIKRNNPVMKDTKEEIIVEKQLPQSEDKTNPENTESDTHHGSNVKRTIQMLFEQNKEWTGEPTAPQRKRRSMTRGKSAKDVPVVAIKPTMRSKQNLGGLRETQSLDSGTMETKDISLWNNERPSDKDLLKRSELLNTQNQEIQVCNVSEEVKDTKRDVILKSNVGTRDSYAPKASPRVKSPIQSDYSPVAPSRAKSPVNEYNPWPVAPERTKSPTKEDKSYPEAPSRAKSPINVENNSKKKNSPSQKPKLPPQRPDKPTAKSKSLVSPPTSPQQGTPTYGAKKKSPSPQPPRPTSPETTPIRPPRVKSPVPFIEKSTNSKSHSKRPLSPEGVPVRPERTKSPTPTSDQNVKATYPVRPPRTMSPRPTSPPPQYASDLSQNVNKPDNEGIIRDKHMDNLKVMSDQNRKSESSLAGLNLSTSDLTLDDVLEQFGLISDGLDRLDQVVPEKQTQSVEDDVTLSKDYGDNTLNLELQFSSQKETESFGGDLEQTATDLEHTDIDSIVLPGSMGDQSLLEMIEQSLNESKDKEGGHLQQDSENVSFLPEVYDKNGAKESVHCDSQDIVSTNDMVLQHRDNGSSSEKTIKLQDDSDEMEDDTPPPPPTSPPPEEEPLHVEPTKIKHASLGMESVDRTSLENQEMEPPIMDQLPISHALVKEDNTSTFASPMWSKGLVSPPTQSMGRSPMIRDQIEDGSESNKTSATSHSHPSYKLPAIRPFKPSPMGKRGSIPELKNTFVVSEERNESKDEDNNVTEKETKHQGDKIHLTQNISDSKETILGQEVQFELESSGDISKSSETSNLNFVKKMDILNVSNDSIDMLPLESDDGHHLVIGGSRADASSPIPVFQPPPPPSESPPPPLPTCPPPEEDPEEKPLEINNLETEKYRDSLNAGQVNFEVTRPKLSNMDPDGNLSENTNAILSLEDNNNSFSDSSTDISNPKDTTVPVLLLDHPYTKDQNAPPKTAKLGSSMKFMTPIPFKATGQRSVTRVQMFSPPKEAKPEEEKVEENDSSSSDESDIPASGVINLRNSLSEDIEWEVEV